MKTANSKIVVRNEVAREMAVNSAAYRVRVVRARKGRGSYDRRRVDA